MKKAAGWGCALVFLALCVGVIAFLNAFTHSESPFQYLTWESAAVVSADGAERSFDPSGTPPEAEEGEFYRFSAVLPQGREKGTWLIFEIANLEAAVFMDGQELLCSSALQDAGTVNMGQVHLSLPEGGGETLTMDLRLLTGDAAIFPPLARLTGDPTDQQGTIAYANYYGIPAGATALTLVLLAGLFLLGLATGKRNWTLLLPTLSAAALVVYPLSVGYGSYFLPEELCALFSGWWLEVLAMAALVLYLLLHRQRAFWRLLLLSTALSAAVLLVGTFFSWQSGGYLYRYLSAELHGLFAYGIYAGLLYWFTLWLILICALLSAWELTDSFARTQADARSLSLRNRLIMENYHALQQKMRESAEQRHEFAHRLLSMEALVQAEDLEGLRRCLTTWKTESSSAAQISFTQNMAMNIILQDAAGRALAAGIDFRASAPVPADLPFPDEDLCTLLMNLLDNALEGAARTPEGTQKSIRFRAKVSDGVLKVQCENTFDGHVETDGQGRLQTIKPSPESHGFGLAQMRAVAEKYGGTLEIRYTAALFTVHASMRLSGKS